MNHRQTLSLWVLVERLEKSAAELDLPADKWGTLCARLIPEWFTELPVDGGPADAEPGSEEKIAAMTRRAAAGLAVFHIHDRVPNHRDIRDDCVPEHEE